MEEGYAKGSVLRVEVRQFMVREKEWTTGATQTTGKRGRARMKLTERCAKTYASCVMEPGPKLNLVLGPNGTGKSSLVCALCVGLAGGTKLLGRADKVGDFVQRGEKWATVTVTLCTGDPERPELVIQRKIKTDNSSEWHMDGISTGIKKVEEKMKEYHVQLDNLCQFLPQDRVAAFASMRPQEMLWETEKALGNSTLHEAHHRLVELQKTLRGAETAVEAKEKQMEKLEQQNKEFAKEIEQFREREALLEQVQVLKKKIPWLQYNEAKERYQESKEKLQEGQHRLEEQQKRLEEQLRPYESRKDELERAKKAKSSAKKAVERLDTEISKCDKELSDGYNAMAEKQAHVEALEEEDRQLLPRIEKMKEEILSLETEIETTQKEQSQFESGALTQRVTDLKQEMRKNNDAIREKNLERSHINEKLAALDHKQQYFEKHVAELGNARMRKVQGLLRSNPQMGKAIEWVENNRARFRKPVYGPVAAEVECSHPMHSSMLEQHCQKYLWSVFVTQTPEDRDLLHENLKQYRTTVSNQGEGADEALQRPFDIQSLKQYGVTQFLDETFKAPAPVKKLLCDVNSIHTAAVAGPESQKHIEHIMNNTPVRCLWTPESQYVKNVSRYNAEAKSVRVVGLRQARILCTSENVADGELQKMKEQLEEVKKEKGSLLAFRSRVDEKLKALNDEGAKVRREQDALIKERNERGRKLQSAVQRVGQKKGLLKRMEQTGDNSAKIEKAKRELLKINEKRISNVTNLVHSNNKLVGALKDLGAATLVVSELEAELGSMKQRFSEVEQEVKKYKAMKADLEHIYEQDKSALRTALERAKKEAPLTDELTQAFETTVHDSVASLEEDIALKMERANAIVCANPNILEEYEERKGRIEKLGRELAVERAELSSRKAEVAALHETWLPQLHELTKKISTTFGGNIAEVGCAGEVSLVEADSYEEYKIEIRVKFRDTEELQVLSASRHSGGERSVSTILYLISLQNLTACPFRVVDEINQGMDPVNERRIFQQLCEAASRPGTPQCFLLTPKLLPDLHYAQEVTILNIFNGPWGKQLPKVWDPCWLYQPTGADAVSAA